MVQDTLPGAGPTCLLTLLSRSLLGESGFGGGGWEGEISIQGLPVPSSLLGVLHPGSQVLAATPSAPLGAQLLHFTQVALPQTSDPFSPSSKDLSLPVPVHLVTSNMASLPPCFSFLAHSTLRSHYSVHSLSPVLDYQLRGLRILVKFIFVSSAVPDMVPHSRYYLILVESINELMCNRRRKCDLGR